jgi:hypothetical protein
MVATANLIIISDHIFRWMSHIGLLQLHIIIARLQYFQSNPSNDLIILTQLYHAGPSPKYTSQLWATILIEIVCPFLEG